MNFFNRVPVRIALALYLSLVFVSCASLFQKKWQRFQDPQKNFSVEFPRGQIQTIAGEGQTLYRLNQDRTVFAASTFLAAESNRGPAGVDRAFVEFPVGFARSVRGKVVSARRADREGLEGTATRVRTGEGACDLRLYHRWARFYFLVVCFPGKAEDTKRNARFFESLRVP